MTGTKPDWAALVTQAPPEDGQSSTRSHSKDDPSKSSSRSHSKDDPSKSSSRSQSKDDPPKSSSRACLKAPTEDGQSSTRSPSSDDPSKDGRSSAPYPPSDDPSKAGRLCKCLFSRSPPPPKLTSVVPVEEKEVGEVAAVSLIATTQMTELQVAPLLGGWDLGPQVGRNIGRKTLVLDLDETLVHSSFRVVRAADIVITVELEGEQHHVYVRKRPFVDQFLKCVAKVYEVVVYTASIGLYANPLLDELDPHGVVSWRLFRETCTKSNAGYMKDLSKLGRDLKDVIIIDNSPICYALQPENAIPIKTWRDDLSDKELLDLIPILYSLNEVDDIPSVLKQIVWAPDECARDTS